MSNFEIADSIQQLDADSWNAAVDSQDPFLSYSYLSALESCGCLGEENGWIPQHLLFPDDKHLNGAMPVYLKDHSYGEFVFDWSWARAAHSAGIPYYPKLVTAIPFTPVTGPRFGSSHSDSGLVLEGIAHLAEQTGASSWHLLFPDHQTSERLLSASSELHLLERRNCHFVWFNRGYQDFDDFLAAFSSRKRKNIRRERKKLIEQEVAFQRLRGAKISQQQMQQFYQFYQVTYHRRGQPPYLTPLFFQKLLETMPNNLMLVRANRNEKMVGAALFIESKDALYGRWWGGVSDIDCLHFEACYYQGIEYAIERGLNKFDPGIQGEHKLLRGFEPEQTRSLHWIREPALAQAVESWLQQERRQIDLYQQQAREHLPFKRGN